MLRQFPSVTYPEKYLFFFDGYAYDSAQVSPSFLVQELVNKSYAGYRHPIPVSLVGEYLMSLATAMLSDDDLSKEAYYKFGYKLDIDELEFASKLIFKEGKKTKYYSKSLKKISGVSSKKWDRRFEPITEEMDGSPLSIFNLMAKNKDEAIIRFMYAWNIRKWLQEKKPRKYWYKYDMPKAAQFVGWTEDTSTSRAIEEAWEACQEALNVYMAKRKIVTHTSAYNNYVVMATLEK